MSTLDLLVLFGTLAFIVIYGTYKTSGSKDIEGYLKGGNSMKWGAIGLSVMATQASAITFLSTPGQAYEDGMRFVQNYFGLPIALIIVSAVFIPIFYKLKVYTAYEYLENRFDVKTRFLGAFLFLVQRGLAAGVTIYAPAIILSKILGWNLNITILLVGLLVVIYTVSGGTKAVTLTQKYQMAIIMGGMVIAFFMVIDNFPDYISFNDAIRVAGKMGKLNAVDFKWDFSERYTFWSGITGGTFLALSYFGTDQSQVQRYLSGKSITESRMGLMFNALLKVPMQFFILFVGIMVFIFYQFHKPPVFFKQHELNAIYETDYANDVKKLDDRFNEVYESKKERVKVLVEAMNNGNGDAVQVAKDEVVTLENEAKSIRSEVKDILLKSDPEMETKDSDYVFITFVMSHLPKGIIGLLIAVIFSAAMSSTSAELNALGSTTTIDFYKRLIRKEGSDKHYVIASKWLTVMWGGLAVMFAFFATLAENLIELVNILGSIFYGTILGIFIVAFFFKYIRGHAVFISAIIVQAIVIYCYFFTDIAYLLFNVIGCALVVIIGFLIQLFMNKQPSSSAEGD
ncbi:sodium:solute symporter [Fulvivirgaceae bacterium BMA10]|uniref:Sodium:solute symporter n=1 Tax=Splendidivirga corallicola TaxID=3051826 RepID=A0ABT8KSP8_9BACT|nr:sodium:solute symporter [Fulvivirgaceae bacterium BMA10]